MLRSNLADFVSGAVWPCGCSGGRHARMRTAGHLVPRQTHDCDAAVLVRRYLPGFLARLEESGQGLLPEFVKAELEGFAVRTACRQCGHELRAGPAVDGGRRVDVHAEDGVNAGLAAACPNSRPSS